MRRAGWIVVGLALLAACASSADKEPADGREASAAVQAARPADTLPQAVTIVAREYAFEVPGPVPAGRTTLRLANRGKEVHHLQLYRLEGERTAADLGNFLRTARPGAPLPGWAVAAGGPGAIVPGGESNATVELEPGSYALLCYVPTHDGTPHFAKGMLQAAEVVPAREAAGQPEPQPDAVVHLQEYDFQLTGPLTPGESTIRVENTGAERHEVHFFRLGAGKTLEDLRGWFESGEQGPPPARPVGGTSVIEPGARTTIDLALEAGEYVLVCFEPAEEDRRPHFMHG
ncbi:MAG: hypothetical protein H0V09_06235, partial [Gemmatimonadetes bacterium]|nr:hypothetical protein [Gemmatimonadota bacterium]